MDDVMNRLTECIPEKLTNVLPQESHKAHVLLLRKAETNLFTNRNFSSAKECAQMVLDATWELLNTGNWKEVSVVDRQIYTVAALIKVFAMLREQSSTSCSDGEADVLKAALQTADFGLLLGAPLCPPAECAMIKVAEILTDALACTCSDAERVTATKSTNDMSQLSDAADVICGIRGELVPCLDRPSLQKFHLEHFKKRKPVKLTGCISHWPALVRWKDINYLRRVAGARTVPIELGAHYVDPEWSQKLMMFSDFLDRHVTSKDVDAPVGYLAQHPLFDQVPALKSDIRVPEYCCISDSTDDDDDVNLEDIDINAWFGPKGTLSPLHQDPKHNILSQVIGEKRVILYNPEDSELLYPHPTTMLENTARVDPENPDYEQFPKFKEARAWECRLCPGDMIYIPPKWWHHVRSLSTSFSVSFWWT